MRWADEINDVLISTAASARTVAALAYSARVPGLIGEVLPPDLEQAGLVQRDQEGRVIVVVPLENFRAGARDLVAKLRTFRYQSERRLGAAQSEECRSVFLRRYFGEEHRPRCGTCDRRRRHPCRGYACRPLAGEPFWKSEAHNDRRTRSAHSS